MKVTIDGMNELNKYFKTVPEEMKVGMKTTLKKICADLQHDAVELAPKRLGILRGSAHSDVIDNGKGVNGYVGFFVSYATKQHEGLDYKHKQGQAKFLETPYKENQNKYVEFVQEEMKKIVDKKK